MTNDEQSITNNKKTIFVGPDMPHIIKRKVMRRFEKVGENGAVELEGRKRLVSDVGDLEGVTSNTKK